MPGICPGCGGRFSDIEGSVHGYMASSPGCWKSYGELLAREYSDPDLFARAHRLTVDAYALQHPGDLTDRRCNQSVWLHYVSLHLIFRVNWSHERATGAIKQLAAGEFEQISVKVPRFSITLADVLKESERRHESVVRAWARHSYDVWDVLEPEAERLVRSL
ncbi:MAG: DUF5946 family protein [Pseudomonadota bacterium]